MVWDIQTRTMVAHAMPNFSDWLSASPQGNILAICGARTRNDEGPGLYLWHFTGRNERLTMGPMKRVSQLVEFSPDGTKIAMGSHRGQQGLSALETPGPVAIADAQSGDVVTTIVQPCRGFAWMPDGRRIVVMRDDNQTHEMYDGVTGAFIRQFEGGPAVGRPFIDRSGHRVMSLGVDDSNRTLLRIWDIETARIQEEIDLGIIQDLGAVRQTMGGYWIGNVGPTGRHVAVSGGLGAVRLWDTENRREMTGLAMRGSAEDGMGFTADGAEIYFSGQEYFGLYHVESDKLRAEFGGPVGGVAVSPDKRQVVSCGNGVVVWDIENGLPTITLSDPGEGDYVSVDWSGDKTRIAAGRADGSVHIWRLPIRP
jgi:WD40 repeat protein